MPLDSQLKPILDQYEKFGAPAIESLTPENARNNPTLKNAVEEMAAESAMVRTLNVAMPVLPEPVGDISHIMLLGGDDEVIARGGLFSWRRLGHSELGCLWNHPAERFVMPHRVWWFQSHTLSMTSPKDEPDLESVVVQIDKQSRSELLPLYSCLRAFVRLQAGNFDSKRAFLAYIVRKNADSFIAYET